RMLAATNCDGSAATTCIRSAIILSCDSPAPVAVPSFPVCNSRFVLSIVGSLSRAAVTCCQTAAGTKAWFRQGDSSDMYRQPAQAYINVCRVQATRFHGRLMCLLGGRVTMGDVLRRREFLCACAAGLGDVSRRAACHGLDANRGW